MFLIPDSELKPLACGVGSYFKLPVNPAFAVKILAHVEKSPAFKPMR